jgi:hypothetical protein
MNISQHECRKFGAKLCGRSNLLSTEIVRSFYVRSVCFRSDCVIIGQGVPEQLTILRYRNCSITFDLAVLQVLTLVTDCTACINITNLCIVSTKNNYVFGVVICRVSVIKTR